MSQIIAGSLAAVTSFLLSAKIGIAGSVIGAAASYVISTLAANIYGTILKASGEKLQEVNPLSGSGADEKDGGDSDGADAGDGDDSKAKAGDAAAEDGDAGDETLVGTLGHGVGANAERPLGIGDVPLPPQVSDAGARTPRVAGTPAANTTTYTVSELRGRRKGRISPKRMAIIVSVVSGLLGVAIAAGLVMLFTHGNGTDTVVRDIVSPTTTSKTTTDDSSTQNGPSTPPPSDGTTGTESGTTGSEDSNGSDTESGTIDGTTGTESGTTGSGSGSTGS
ncbi:hypothetical protein, partial [Bifidobacterium platyrrhinorum]|uniref:hypothetical protein n=1 Tax=Bifidobacterium platyrrhinorum TaxID=2661628 RepID=UPI0013D06AC5